MAAIDVQLVSINAPVGEIARRLVIPVGGPLLFLAVGTGAAAGRGSSIAGLVGLLLAGTVISYSWARGRLQLRRARKMLKCGPVVVGVVRDEHSVNDPNAEPGSWRIAVPGWLLVEPGTGRVWTVSPGWSEPRPVQRSTFGRAEILVWGGRAWRVRLTRPDKTTLLRSFGAAAAPTAGLQSDERSF